MLNDLLCFLFKPKYVIMKGVQINNRAILFIGAHPVFKKDEYDRRVVCFSNVDCDYYPENICKQIWTFRSLIEWRRLIGKNTRCLQKKMFRWERIL